MIQLLKAFVIVFALSAGGFLYARLAFKDVVSAKVIDRWALVFMAMTLAVFFVPNYWAFLFVIALICVTLGQVEKFKPALYMLVLFTAPTSGAVVPGFGPINNFLLLYPFNILAIFILTPNMFRLKRPSGGVGAATDIIFAAFMVISLALAFRATSITDGFRQAFAFFLTAVPQYYVFSRTKWTPENLRLVTAAIVLPFVAFSAIAAAESILHWHFYGVAAGQWDVISAGKYLDRQGMLRAYATLLDPISFGLATAIAFTLAPALISSVSAKSRLFAFALLPILGVGLLASLSRGPWVGAAAGVALLVITSQKAFRNFFLLAGAGVICLLVLSLSPFGSSFLELIPFIGNVNEDTIDYRQRLLKAGWTVVQRNPFFGSENYLNAPELEAMRQGQGIIDLVNTYLAIALDKGLIGMSLFVGVLATALAAVFFRIGKARQVAPELAPYCQGYAAALLCVMVILATTAGQIAQIFEAMWVVCGVCLGLARTVAMAAGQPVAVPVAPAVAAPDAAPPPRRKTPEATPPASELPAHLRQYARNRD